MEENRLNTVIYFESELELKAPLALGNGEGLHADRDVFLDWKGCAVIPGSSIAGVLYHHFEAALSEDEKRKKALDCLWGISDKDGQNISSMIIFHDAICEEQEGKKERDDRITIRDQVRISGETGTASDMGKYDFEAVNPGSVFRFRMELVLREKYAGLREYAEEILNEIVYVGVHDGWRFGSKTSRGYGKTVLENPRWAKLDFAAQKEAAVNKYVAFTWDDSQLEEMDIAEIENPVFERRDWKISVPLKLNRTMNIRSYHNAAWDVDSRQLTVLNVNGEQDRAVIPGTSWAGAFRSHMIRILGELAEELGKTGQYDFRKDIISLFGEEKNEKRGHRSRIFFEESEDLRKKKSKFADVSRIRIDRFTGAVMSGALVTERVTVDGEYNLNIIIHGARDYEKGLVCLAVEDLLEGGLAVGGETGIGRGIFCLRNTDVSFANMVEGSDKLEDWYEALKNHLEEMDGTK